MQPSSSLRQCPSRDAQAELTQERIAETLCIGQDHVSRLEQRSDLLISTLRSYVEAMGQQFEACAPQIKRWRKERPPSCRLHA